MGYNKNGVTLSLKGTREKRGLKGVETNELTRGMPFKWWKGKDKRAGWEEGEGKSVKNGGGGGVMIGV